MNKVVSCTRGVAVYLIIFLLMGCSSPGSTTIPASTPTRPPTGSSAGAAPSPTPRVWFSEHFDDGMPPGWTATSGWGPSTSGILSTQKEQTFNIPGAWTDLVIRARVRRGPAGWSSIGFRNKGDNYYQFSFSDGLFVLGRHHAGTVQGQSLALVEKTLDEGWHNVEIRAVGGKISIKWDGILIVDLEDQDPVGTGDVFFQNWDNSLYEVDLVEIAPPEATVLTTNEPGTGNTTVSGSTGPQEEQPTGVYVETPSQGGGPVGGRPGGDTGFATDLAISTGYLDGRGNLIANIINYGPHAFVGSLGIACTIWYEVPGQNPVGIGNSTSVSVVLEPGQSVDEQPGCTMDNSQGGFLGANLAIDVPPADPESGNNYFNVSP